MNVELVYSINPNGKPNLDLGKAADVDEARELVRAHGGGRGVIRIMWGGNILWQNPALCGGKANCVPAGYYAVDGKRYHIHIATKGKWAANLFLSTGSDYHNRKTIAHVLSKGFYSRNSSEHGKAVLDRIAANPFQHEVEYGKITGKCSRCGRKLEDALSIARGMGPVCIQKG